MVLIRIFQKTSDVTIYSYTYLPSSLVKYFFEGFVQFLLLFLGCMFPYVLRVLLIFE